MIPIFAIVPLLAGAFISLAMARKATYVKHVAIASSIASLAVVLYMALYPGVVNSMTWFSLGGATANFVTSTAPLNLLLLVIVALMTPLILVYSSGYMKVSSEQPRYYFLICLFAASMMLFAISASFLTLMVAWEMLGITSYLLIGFWYWKESASQAARKAITTILAGDLAMLSALILIFHAYNSLDFSVVLHAPASPALYAALVLISVAAFTKSAQFPLNEWLADAMEGPTPVSAFLHSSTMVKAGVFLVLVLFPLYKEASLLGLFLVAGSATAIIGALNALSEKHIKRILAYSTMEDLGLMFVAIGLGSVVAALLLFVVQTFYKALLFMSSGIMMEANDGRTDITSIYWDGSGKLLMGATLVGVLSLAALFPLGGFFGKAAVDASSNTLPMYALLLVVQFVSVIYIFRWFFIPLHRTPNVSETDVGIGYKTIPLSMLSPVLLLAIFAALSSLTYLYLPSYLGFHPVAISFGEWVAVTATIAAGGYLANFLYRRNVPARARAKTANGFFNRVAYSSPYINMFYMLLVRILFSAAAAVSAFDGLLGSAVGYATGLSIKAAYLLRRAEDGQTNVYIIAMVVGMIAIVAIFYL